MLHNEQLTYIQYDMMISAPKYSIWDMEKQ